MTSIPEYHAQVAGYNAETQSQSHEGAAPADQQRTDHIVKGQSEVRDRDRCSPDEISSSGMSAAILVRCRRHPTPICVVDQP
jgi:hypothetical protein